MKPKKIIYQPWGGLGDNLQYSTLPEKFANIGYDVYIHSNNAYRNPEIKELVWDKNPYIVGETNEQPNAGSLIEYSNVTNESFIKNIEIGHGLVPTNLFPKIYVDIKDNDFYKNKIFIDSGYISPVINDESFAKIVDNIYSQHKDKEIFVLVFNKYIGQIKTVNLNNYPIFIVESIFHYCELIKNCFGLIGHMSGGCVLASAIKSNKMFPNISVLIGRSNWDNIVFRNKLYYFNNVQYIVY